MSQTVPSSKESIESFTRGLLADGESILASSPAIRRFPAPRWVSAAGIAATAGILLGFILRAPALTIAGTGIGVALIATSVITFLVKRRCCVLAVTQTHFFVLTSEGDRVSETSTYEYRQIHDIRLAKARVGPSTLHIDPQSEEAMTLTLSRNPESERLIEILHTRVKGYAP